MKKNLSKSGHKSCEMKGISILLFAAFICDIVSAQSEVRWPPTMLNTPQRHITYRKYNRITLECRAEGTPAVGYKWKKNGLEFDTNLQNIQKESDGTIIIYGATETDEGYYQCYAMNQYGTALSDAIDVRMAFIDSSGPQHTLQQTVFEGMPFLMHADRRRSYPAPNFIWYKSALKGPELTLLVPTVRKQFAENGDLHFAYALSEDASRGNVYYSYSRNSFLNELSGGINTNLTVTANPTGNISEFAPTLAFSSAEQTLGLVGGKVTLRCFFYGYPVPAIGWKGPNSTMRSGRFTKTGTGVDLSIGNITESDAGIYSCTGSNTMGNSTQSLQLRVGVVPVFRNKDDGPCHVNIIEGKSVTFNCKATAKPEAHILWFQNGQQLNTDHLPERCLFSKDLKSLTIKDVCRDCVDSERNTDLMVIQCNASNVHGYAFAQGYVNVLKGDAKSEESWTVWKTIVVAGAICVVLLLFGITCLFQRLKQISDVDKRMNNRRLPNLPSIYDDVGYESIGFPLDELSGNKDDCMIGVGLYSPMYDHIDYDCMALNEDTPDGCHRYESIADIERKAMDKDRPMLNEGMTREDVGYLTPLDEIEIDGKINQQKVHGCITGEPEIITKINEESVSMNTYTGLIRVEVSDNTAVEEANSKSREGISQIDPVSGESSKGLGQDQNDGNPYLDLISKEGNPYLDLVSKEGNPYLDLVSKEGDPNINEGPEEINPILVSEEVSQYLDLGTREVDL